MKKISNISLVFLSVLIASATFAQRYNKVDNDFVMGDNSSKIKICKNNYDKAIDENEKADILFEMACWYRSVKNIPSAESHFRKLVINQYHDSIIYKYYAEALRSCQKYDKAIENYNIYLKFNPDDRAAKFAIEGCELAILWQDNPTRFKVENKYAFNTAQIEYSPVFADAGNNSIYFTTTRWEVDGKKLCDLTGQKFADIFYSEYKGRGRWTKPMPIGPEINTNHEEATPAFNKSFNELYFARCRVVRNNINGCQLYYATKSSGKWGDVAVIPMGNDTTMVGYPSLSYDELSLYFSANLPGSYGGTDIWMISRDDTYSNWNDPVNLGPEINTPGNETAPYMPSDGQFYFASDYHIGMGGLDIFKASHADDGKWVIENMQYPINSYADDFGIIFNDDNQSGFLTSKRKPGLGFDDIFQFSFIPYEYKLQLAIVSKDENTIIDNAKVRLFEQDSVDIASSEGKGQFNYVLNKDVNYRVEIAGVGFIGQQISFSTCGIEDDSVFSFTVHMESLPIVDPTVVDPTVVEPADEPLLMASLSETPKFVNVKIVHSEAPVLKKEKTSPVQTKTIPRVKTNTVLDRQISLKAEEKPLSEVIQEISELASVKFSYSSSVIPVGKNITIDANNKCLEEILTLIINDQQIDYRAVNDLVIIYKTNN